MAAEDLVELQRRRRAVDARAWRCPASRTPVYAGVSCTNRSPTIEGEITAALASAGTLYFAS